MIQGSENDMGNTQAIPRFRRLAIGVLLGALTTFGPLATDMYLPSLPDLARDLTASPSLIQLSLTTCLLGMSPGQLFIGVQSDVRGRRIPLVTGLIGFTVSSVFCAVSSSIFWLIVLRFIQGIGVSAGIVVSRAIVRDLYSGPDLVKFYALLTLVFGAGPIFAPIAGAQLMHITSWRGIFLTLGAIGVFMLLMVLLILPETLPVDRRSRAGLRSTVSTFRGLSADRVFLGYALAQGLVAAAMFGYIADSTFVFQDIFGVSPQMFSLLFAVNGAGLIVASQLTGRLAGRIKETTLFVIGLGIAALGGLLLLGAILAGAGLFAILPPLFAVVSSQGIVSPAGFALAMQNYGHAAGSAAALLGLTAVIFGAGAAPLAGIGGSATAVPMGVVIAVAVAGAVASHFLLNRRGAA